MAAANSATASAQARRLPRLRPRATAMIPSPIATEAIRPAVRPLWSTKSRWPIEKRTEVAVGSSEKIAVRTDSQARGRRLRGRVAGALPACPLKSPLRAE